MKKVLLFLLLLVINIEGVWGVNIVSLGDSIPHGYLLSDEKMSYDNMIAEKLDANYYEYSVVGMTSYELLDYLRGHESDEYIKDADIIFLYIGSNDFLDLLFEMELDGLNLDTSAYKYMDVQDGFNLNTFFKSLKDTITGTKFNEAASSTLDRLKHVYPEIVGYIRNLNSDAKIYVFNIYNPYFNFNNPIVDLSYLSDCFEKYITNFNEFLAQSDEYTIIDSYNILRNYKLINVDLLTLNLDPHPNKYGHQALYDELLSTLTYKVKVYSDDENYEIYYVLKGDTLTLEKPSKKGYKFTGWDHDLNNINDNITIKPKFKRNINIYLICISSIISLIIIVILYRMKKKRA